MHLVPGQRVWIDLVMVQQAIEHNDPMPCCGARMPEAQGKILLRIFAEGDWRVSLHPRTLQVCAYCFKMLAVEPNEVSLTVEPPITLGLITATQWGVERKFLQQERSDAT